MKSENLVFVLFILVITGIIGGVFYVKANSSPQEESSSRVLNTDSQNNQMTNNSNAANSQDPNTRSTFTELIKEDTVVGTGAEAEKGKTLKVNYIGKFLDGTVFDSSLKDGRTPFEFVLGEGSVIQGWDLGFEGMKVGGKRILKIPSKLAYGESGAGDAIKPNSDLIFEVELLEVK